MMCSTVTVGRGLVCMDLLFVIFGTLNAMLPYSLCQTEARLPRHTCRG